MRSPVFGMFVLILTMLAVSCASPPPSSKPIPSQAEAAQPSVASAAKASSQSPASEGLREENPPAAAAQPEASHQELGAQDQAFLQSYTARLRYLVYFDEGLGEDPGLAKIAINQANRYLNEKEGLAVMDFTQVSHIRSDQTSGKEAGAGTGTQSLLALARKASADAYIEIGFSLSSGQVDGKYSASSQGSMKIYDPWSEMLLGQLPLTQVSAYSPDSAAAAESNAVANAVWLSMPKAASQSRTALMGFLTKGLRYQLTLQNLSDSGQLRSLEKSLASRFGQLRQLSSASSQIVLEVYAFKDGDQVRASVLEAASEAGLAKLQFVEAQGRFLRFSSGS